MADKKELEAKTTAEAEVAEEKKAVVEETTEKAADKKAEAPKKEEPKKEAKEEKKAEDKEEHGDPELVDSVQAESDAKVEIKKEEKEAPKKEVKVKEAEEEQLKVANEDFDWDAYVGELDFYGGAAISDIEAKYEETIPNVQEGEIIEGTVIGLDDREVTVDVGYKSDAVIPTSEFRYNPELAVGERVEVYVEREEDVDGQLVLSHTKARQLKSWDRVNEAHDSDEIIKGYIKCRTKGGMIVDIFGIESFLPGSQIDVRPIRDYDMYVGKTMEFKVIKINPEFRNVVVSHKALIEAELEAQRKEIMAKLEKGQVLEGTVKNITSYGAFIDLGGVDGLVHITDLSWGRINHPEEVVSLDEKVNVAILDFDEQKKRIALGIKQLTPHPWDSLSEELKVGDKVKGRVVVMADYGAFVEISQGVEGLIHVSEMSWSQHLRSAQDFLKVGDEVDAVVLTLDREERKMSLGMRQLTPDPWEGIEQRYPVGSRHTAKVRNFTNFGIFAEMEEGIDGLIHISDLSWTEKIKHPEDFTDLGADIDVIVLEVDVENRRLSLGHKQIEENPWNKFEDIYTVDSVHKGTIKEINENGAIVVLEEDVEGFAPARQLVKEDGSRPEVGDELEFKVLEFSKATRRIVLSHTRIHDESRREQERTARAKKRQDAAQAKTAMRQHNLAAEVTTLGDISGLAELRAQMEKGDDEGEAEAEVEVEEKPKAEKKPEAEAKPEEKKEEAEKPAEEPKEEAAEEKAEKKESKEETEEEK